MGPKSHGCCHRWGLRGRCPLLEPLEPWDGGIENPLHAWGEEAGGLGGSCPEQNGIEGVYEDAAPQTPPPTHTLGGQGGDGVEEGGGVGERAAAIQEVAARHEAPDTAPPATGRKKGMADPGGGGKNETLVKRTTNRMVVRRTFGLSWSLLVIGWALEIYRL